MFSLMHMDNFEGLRDSLNKIIDSDGTHAIPGLRKEDDATYSVLDHFSYSPIVPMIARPSSYVFVDGRKKGDPTIYFYVFRSEFGSVDWTLQSACKVNDDGSSDELPISTPEESPDKAANHPTTAYARQSGTEQKNVSSKGSVVMDWDTTGAYFRVDVVRSGIYSPRWWMVWGPGNQEEKSLDSTEELIKYFYAQPKKRQQKGIIMFGSLAHLQDVDKSKAEMSEHQKKCVTDPRYLAVERDFIATLVAVCKEKSIDLWINTTMGDKDVEFINLTKDE
jgi:hypothetical protein